MTGARFKFAALTAFGLGMLRPAPGTWGSLPPAAAAWLLLLAGAPAVVRELSLALVCCVACAVCLAWGAWGEVRLARKDARQIVADEVAGMCLPLLLWPQAFADRCAALGPDRIAWDAVLRSTLAVLAAFLLFRVFDILKPPPARAVQRIAGGAGILLDDLIAGAYSAAIVQVVLRLFDP